MSAIQKIGKEGVVMTLKEITDLIGADHSKAMKKIEKLSEEPSFGGIDKMETPTFNPDGSVNRNIDTYLLTGKQAIAAGAKLNNKMLMMVVNRVEELEAEKIASQQFNLPQTFAEALKGYARAEEDKERLLLSNTKKQATIDVLYHGQQSYSATQVAKDFGVSSAKLFNQILKDAKVIYKSGKTYVLLAKYQGFGLTQIKETEPDENDNTFLSMRWTPIGKDWLHKNWDKILERISDDVREKYEGITSSVTPDVPKKQSKER